MQIEFDPDKRDKTLAERGLDFAQAGEVFAGVNVTAEDMPVLTMVRKANEREIARFAQALG